MAYIYGMAYLFTASKVGRDVVLLTAALVLGNINR